VAKLIADVGIITITSFISPYRFHRDQAREIHRQADLDFFEIFVDAPLSVCEQRDPKGLYKRARAGELKGMTGLDDPYEPPLKPDLVVHTDRVGPTEAVDQAIQLLVQRGYARSKGKNAYDDPNER